MKSQSNSQDWRTIENLEIQVNTCAQLFSPERFDKILKIIFEEFAAIDTIEEQIRRAFS